MKEIRTADYGKVYSLFTGLMGWNLSVNAGLENTMPGRVFVDDADDPKTALMVVPEGNYLVGEVENPAFIAALNENLFSDNPLSVQAEVIHLVYHPDSWRGKVAEIFHPRPPITARRQHYTFKGAKVDWRNNIPAGFTIERIDSALLNRPGLDIPNQINDWMNDWGSVEMFLQRGFGFCAVHDNRIVCWCISDCVSGNACEIGIHTAPDYRRRGLATLTVAATVDFCITNGFATIGWHCDEDNFGSRGVAEAVGFEKDLDYCAHYCYVDEVTHLAERGYVAFKAGQHQQTADLYEEVFALRPDSPDFWYHLAARTWGVLGNQDKALDYLNAAIDRGWTAINHTQHCTEFTILHGTPGWEAALTRMQTRTP